MIWSYYHNHSTFWLQSFDLRINDLIFLNTNNPFSIMFFHFQIFIVQSPFSPFHHFIKLVFELASFFYFSSFCHFLGHFNFFFLTWNFLLPFLPQVSKDLYEFSPKKIFDSNSSLGSNFPFLLNLYLQFFCQTLEIYIKNWILLIKKAFRK